MIPENSAFQRCMICNKYLKQTAKRKYNFCAKHTQDFFSWIYKKKELEGAKI